MRIPSRNTRGRVTMNMTPMIDVVFLLIIFFLVSSHLARQETQVALDLPTASTGEPLEETAQQRVTINVMPDGQVLLAGRTVAPEELAAKLTFERSRSGNDLEVRIRGDREVTFSVIEPLLVACAEAGVWNVTFGVHAAKSGQ
ncbi:MAG: biopolymer transporter ExbD [Pirellulales bacterium]